MLKNAFIVSVTIALSATALPAQNSSDQSANDAAASAGNAQEQSTKGVITARMLQEATVVSLEGQYDEGVWEDNAPLSAMVADLTEIGHVEDIVLSSRGDVRGVTIDVGGFLGIATKTVLVSLDDMRLAQPEPGSDDLTIVTRLNEQQLDDLPEFQLDD